MKPTIRFVLLLVATGLLLAACSGGSSPDEGVMVVNTAGQEDGNNLEVENVDPETEEASEELADSLAEEAIFEPTPSPLIEQSYRANPVSDRDYSEFEIVTLLPRDAIPALSFPSYYKAERADNYYDPEEIVIGIEFNGDARAYSVGLLSRHEIVNDEVGGIKLAVTW